MKFFIMFAVVISVLFSSGNGYSTSSNWLMQIDKNDEKFSVIQKQFRGFDTAMMEVGYRYDAIKKALETKNYQLAHYHLEKMKLSIENGYIRRPAREKASQNYFLNTTFKEFQEALSLRDANSIVAKFSDMKNSCNACHADQKVEFIIVE